MTPDTIKAQNATDFLFEELTKLDAPITYTASKALVQGIADRLATHQSGDGVREALEHTQDALKAMLVAVKNEPAMQGRKYVSLGIQVNEAIDKAAKALSAIPLASDRVEAVQQEAVAWRCFHCGVVCRTEAEAIEHFGMTMDYQTACQGNGGMQGQRLRHEVKKLLNGIDTGAVILETVQDETLERTMKFIRYAVDHFEAAPVQPRIDDA